MINTRVTPVALPKSPALSRTHNNSVWKTFVRVIAHNLWIRKTKLTHLLWDKTTHRKSSARRSCRRRWRGGHSLRADSEEALCQRPHSLQDSRRQRIPGASCLPVAGRALADLAPASLLLALPAAPQATADRRAELLPRLHHIRPSPVAAPTEVPPLGSVPVLLTRPGRAQSPSGSEPVGASLRCF